MKKRMAIAAALALAPNSALAQEDDHKWSAGAIGFVNPSPFVGEKTEIRVFPYVSYSGDRVYLRGLEAGYKAIKPQRGAPGAQVSFDMMVRARPQPGSSRDGFSLDAGARFGVDTSIGTVALTALQEVSGKHDGLELELGLSRRFSGADWAITPSLSVAWQSRGLANYLWGVSAADRLDMVVSGTNALLPAFELDGSVVNANAGLVASYDLTARWSMVLFGRATWLGSNARENPWIDNRMDASVGLAVAYAF